MTYGTAVISTVDFRMIWPGFVNQSVVSPCHLPGRQRLPQLLLLEFILQTEQGEPCNSAKNKLLEES